jgi:hypothetical protein
MLRSLRRLVAVTCVVCPALALGASAHGAWGPVEVVDADGPESLQNIPPVVGPGGDAAVAQLNGGRLQFLQRTADGIWSSPSDLGPARFVTLAGDQHGGALIVALVPDPANPPQGQLMVAAYRPAGGSLGPFEQIASLPALRAPTVALAPDGRAVAAWSQPTGQFTSQVVTSVRRPDGTWTAAAPLSADRLTNFVVTNVAVDSEDHAYVAWLDQIRFPVHEELDVAEGSLTDGTFGTPVMVDEHDAPRGRFHFQSYNVDLAVSPHGHAALAFAGPHSIRVTEKPAGSMTWSTPLPASKRDEGSAPSIGIDGNDHAVVAWFEPASKGSVTGTVMFAERGARRFSAPRSLSGQAGNGRPSLTTSTGASALVTWTTNLGTRQVIASAFRDAAGAWSPAATVADFDMGFTPPIALGADATGQAYVIWEQSDRVVRAAHFTP